VIADVLLPEIDGFEFVRRLRAEPAIAHTRVIFYTAAYLESEARVLAAACGVAHVLIKPTDPPIILSTVQEVLGEPAVAIPSPPAAAFAQAHERLLLDKLAQKVDELEALNAGLEQQVAARTAELADANVHLRELNAFKDNLLAITSHDLRSPLGAIQNMAEVLLVEMDLPDDARRMVQHIDNATRLLLAMVSNMLDLSKLEAGKVELLLSQLRASDIARTSLEALAMEARVKAIDIHLVVEPGEPLVQADGMKLVQVFNNLLSNAIKFTPSGGLITITVGPEPAGVRIGVADTGLGIPAEQLPHLFEKFHQVHARGTAGERGSGLGLAIVRELVELHGGSIEVASEVQRGSTFTLHLPAGVETLP
jgi:signal transduction histidine kinase